MDQEIQAPSDPLPLRLMDLTPTTQVGLRTQGQATQALPEPSTPGVHGSSTHHAGISKDPGQTTWALPDPSHLGLRDPDPSCVWAQGSGPEDPGPSGLPITRAHGSSTHHAGRSKNLGQVTQALLDPHLWGSRTQHPQCRWTQGSGPGDPGPARTPYPWGSWTWHPPHR